MEMLNIKCSSIPIDDCSTRTNNITFQYVLRSTYKENFLNSCKQLKRPKKIELHSDQREMQVSI